MIILGLNCYHADSSASIFVDGKLIAASEEERFLRIKHWAGFPSESIKFCLREANVSIHDIDYITIDKKTNYTFAENYVDTEFFTPINSSVG